MVAVASQSTDKSRALYEIVVGGQAIPEQQARDIREIRIQDYLALPDVCTFTVGFPAVEGKDPFGNLDKHPFEIGKKLEIKLAERDSLVTKSVFKGDIVTLEPNFTSGGAEMTVRAFDRSYKLTRRRNTQSFEDMSASDIVSKVVKAAGLRVQTDSTPTVFKFMQQSNETDLDFIWRLANRINYEFVVEDDKAIFRKIGSTQPVELEWPNPLHTFSPRMSAVQQVQNVTVRGWDFQSKQKITGTKQSPEQVIEAGVKRSKIKNAISGASTTIVNEPVQDKGEADALAQATLDRLANSYVQAQGTLDGNPAVRSGAVIEVKGVGKQFGGKYRVQSSVHVLRGGSTYTTEFSSSSIQTLTGAMTAKPADFGSQLVIGLVTDSDDPYKLGRVRVKFPTLNDTQGWWARVTQPNAGKERGMMMLPQPGDEVLVGFEHNDTTRPYVIGSLYNGGNEKPKKDLDLTDASLTILTDHKLTARAKEEIEVEGGKTYTVKVKGDVTETFDAKWSVTTKGDVSMTIGQMGKLTIVADGNISIQSKMGNIEMKAMQISINANAGLTLNGGAQTKVSGGMIQIG